MSSEPNMSVQARSTGNEETTQKRTLASDSSRSETAVVTNQMILVNGTSEFDLQLLYRLDEAGYFTRPKPESENRLVRFIDKTFQPEIIHFSKVDVQCSLITAIKRRNPLCLLNPLFFNLSW